MQKVLTAKKWCCNITTLGNDFPRTCLNNIQIPISARYKRF